MNPTYCFKAWKSIRLTPTFTRSCPFSSWTKAFSVTGRGQILPGKSLVRTLSDKARVIPNSLSRRSLSMSTQPEHNPHRFYEPRTEDVIRATNLYHNRSKWGFVICRCTYKSQAKWDEFMSRIKDDARQYLKNDPDLFESMDWTVLADSKLDNAHYVVAARRFGDWAKRSLIEESKAATSKRINNGPDRWQPGKDPRYEAFIYANEDAVNSVVEHPDGENKAGAEDYVIYLVNYDAVLEKEKNNQEIIDMIARRDAGETLPGDEQIGDSLDDVVDLEKEDLDLADDSQEWRQLRIKFRASDLVPGYATVEDERGWESGFDCAEQDIYVPEIFDTSAVRNSDIK